LHTRTELPRAERMTPRPAALPWWMPALLAGALLASLPAAGATAAPPAAAATALRARHDALRERLEHSPFRQRLVLESVAGARSLAGDVYAEVDYPLATVSAALTSPAHWCDLLILHLNVKYCHPVARDRGSALSVAIGRKFDQTLADAYRVEFAFGITAADADYVAVDLNADKGPLGTTNYSIALEAIALEPGRAFVHLRYAYQYGLEVRLAMDAYLATTGAGKVGFSTVPGADDGAPQLVGGLRGAVERNTMRYFLAIDAYLGALAVPASQRFEQSLGRWYDATELYPRQLHEADRATYLAMKRREYLRQQLPP
jgi:hypothetical protein